MFNNLFKSKWQHPDVNVRTQALDELAWEKEQDRTVIINIAANDEDESLRHRAFDKITNLAPLQELLATRPSAIDWMYCACHLMALFPEQSEALIKTFRHSLSDWESPSLVAAFNANCERDGVVHLVDAIEDSERLSHLILGVKSLALRLHVIEQINDVAILQQLSKKVTDKQLSQKIRAKIKDHKAHQQQIEAVAEQADKLITSLQRLARLPWDKQYEYKLLAIVENWQKLDFDLVSDKFVAFDKALAACQEIVKVQQQKDAEEALHQAAQNKQTMLLEQLKKLMTEILEDHHSSHHPLQDAVNLIDKNWLQISQDPHASSALNAEYSELKHELLRKFKAWELFEKLIPEFYDLFELDKPENFDALQKWVNQWNRLIEKLNWPKQMALPAIAVDWTARAESFIEQLQVQIEAQKNKANLLSQKLSVLQKHIKAKNLIAANKLFNFIEHKVKDIHPDFLGEFSSWFDRILPQLEELRDWHSFATTPKKESLCQAMETLVESPLAPIQQAEAIKSLQQQWHDLTASDSNADDHCWERFKQASDLAFQPCREYYAQQDQIKEENLESRLKICQRMEELFIQTDWSNADWKMLDSRLQQASSEWNNYAPVPDKAHKSAKKRFDKALNRIKDKIKLEKQRNLELRKELVERADKLQHMNDLEKSIALAIELQQQWKQIGVTFYKADKQQWQLFRKAIDAVFAKKQLEKQNFVDEIKANEKQLKALTAKVGALLKLDDHQLQQSHDEFEQLLASWDGSLILPKASANKLLAHFHSVCDQYRVQFAGIADRMRASLIDELASYVEVLRQSEQRLLNKKTLDREQLKISLAKLTISNELQQSLQPRLDTLLSDAPVTVNKAGLNTMQELTLKAEIAAGVESPPAFKTQRMAIQLRQLQDGLTAKPGHVEIRNKVLDIYYQWITIGFVPEADYLPLASRMDVVRKRFV